MESMDGDMMGILWDIQIKLWIYTVTSNRILGLKMGYAPFPANSVLVQEMTTYFWTNHDKFE